MYQIAFRHDRNLIDIRWTGLFDDAAVDAYASELQRRFRDEGFRPGYRLRMDMSACTVQPVDVAAAINRRLGHFHRASRIAIIASSAITRMQVRRFMAQPYLRIFDTAAESDDWLIGDDVAVAA